MVETLYSPELAHRICDLIMDGQPLRVIGEREDMPCADTLKRWIRSRDDFRALYIQAKQVLALCEGEEMVQILNDVDLEDAKDRATAGARVRLAAEKVKLRQWMLERMLPRVFGAHTQVTARILNPATAVLLAMSTEERAEWLGLPDEQKMHVIEEKLRLRGEV